MSLSPLYQHGRANRTDLFFLKKKIISRVIGRLEAGVKEIQKLKIKTAFNKKKCFFRLAIRL